VQERTAHISVPSQRHGELEERDWLEQLFRRLLPFVYDFPQATVEQLVAWASPRPTQAERQYLIRRLAAVRRKPNLAVVSLHEEDLLLPLTPTLDPRQLPLVALWCDGGFYTAKERRPGHQNIKKLRQLGLVDGVAAYVSYRAVIFAPVVKAPAWQHGPLEVTGMTNAYEAEAKAVEIGLAGVIERLERERHVPPVDHFYVALYSDCQGLIKALSEPASETAPQPVREVQVLKAYFGGIFPIWQPRRRIKQLLGH
jgi:hypothetical protein